MRRFGPALFCLVVLVIGRTVFDRNQNKDDGNF